MPDIFWLLYDNDRYQKLFVNGCLAKWSNGYTCVFIRKIYFILYVFLILEGFIVELLLNRRGLMVVEVWVLKLSSRGFSIS